MSQDYPDTPHDRLLALLVDRAAFGLSAAEEDELQKLLAEFPEADPEEFERLAAAIDRSLSPAITHALPAALQARVSEDAVRFFAMPPQNSLVSRGPASELSPPSRSWAWLGWCAAAVCLLLALTGWWQVLNPQGTRDLATVRQALLAEPGVVNATLGKMEVKSSAEGDIVWSDTAQQGFMRLSGLPINNPQREQYQLWIFDDNQDPRYPIDGGVFDITATGEVIVPIRPAIRVADTTMFAITVERPGGVVVSSRERIVLLGKVAERTVN